VGELVKNYLVIFLGQFIHIENLKTKGDATIFFFSKILLEGMHEK
jgi:hypothetical protein